MREPRYSILVDIQDATERAKQGKLALYWQRTIQREYQCKKVTPAEQQAYEQLQSILSEVPQWSDEEELHHDMEHTGANSGSAISGSTTIPWYNWRKIATADFILPMFWTQTPPQRCAGRPHNWRKRNLRNVCRHGVFRHWMRRWRNK